MDSILYTDGHGTRVTSHEFVTKDSRYLIQGIVDARVNKVRSSPFPALLCLLFGLLLAALGFFHILDNSGTRLVVGSLNLSPNGVAVLAGFVFAFIGIVALSLRQRKYAVHITTAEGEKDPIVSRRHDYVRQIVAAIQNALIYERNSPPGTSYVPPAP